MTRFCKDCVNLCPMFGTCFRPLTSSWPPKTAFSTSSSPTRTVTTPKVWFFKRDACVLRKIVQEPFRPMVSGSYTPPWAVATRNCGWCGWTAAKNSNSPASWATTGAPFSRQTATDWFSGRPGPKLSRYPSNIISASTCEIIFRKLISTHNYWPTTWSHHFKWNCTNWTCKMATGSGNWPIWVAPTGPPFTTPRAGRCCSARTTPVRTSSVSNYTRWTWMGKWWSRFLPCVPTSRSLPVFYCTCSDNQWLNLQLVPHVHQGRKIPDLCIDEKFDDPARNQFVPGRMDRTRRLSSQILFTDCAGYPILLCSDVSYSDDRFYDSRVLYRS